MRIYKKAIVAVARAILTAVYIMLKCGVDYHDLGPDHFQRTERTQTQDALGNNQHLVQFQGSAVSADVVWMKSVWHLLRDEAPLCS